MTVINSTVQKASVSPMESAAGMVKKYTAALMNDKRAQQFAWQMSIMSKDPKTGAALMRCTAESLITAMMMSVHLDLMPNTSQGLAYIIPYGNVAQFQLGYAGILELVYRAGFIKSANAELVFPEDEFYEELGTNRQLVHKPNKEVKNRTDWNAATHVYATAKLTSGEFIFTVLTKEEVTKVRAKAQASSGPWKDWPEAMAKKSALKRLLKYLPKSQMRELAKAEEWENKIDAGYAFGVDENTGEIIEGQITTNAVKEAEKAITEAKTREELAIILNGLPVEDRKQATSLVNERLKEL